MHLIIDNKIFNAASALKMNDIYSKVLKITQNLCLVENIL